MANVDTAPYFIDYIDANTFYLRSVPAGTRINATVSQSGVHTCWDAQDHAIATNADIFGTGQVMASTCMYAIPFSFQRGAAIDTTASGWRFRFVQGTGTWNNMSIMANVATAPFFIAYSSTTTSYTTSDAPVLAGPTTIDQNVTFKGTVQCYPPVSTGNTIAFAGFVCTPDKDHRAYSTTGAGNGMLIVDTSAARTITVDGSVLSGSQAGLYFGTEASPASYANKIVINYLTPTFAGATSTMSGFGDLSYGFDYSGGGQTLVKSGAYPAKTYATLTADANTGQKDVVVDDGSIFSPNDYVYISKHDAVYGTGLDATRYQISSIAGNTLTMTVNITTNKRLIGGRVILLERGYGIQEYGQSLANYSFGERFNNPVNYYKVGMYNRGTAPKLNFGTSYQFFDLVANRRADGHYVDHCLSENYQNAQNSTVAAYSSIMPQPEGVLFQNNIAIHCRLFLNVQKLVTLLGGVAYKSGNGEVANCFSMRTSETLPFASGSSAASSTLNVHDNVAHNCAAGLRPGASFCTFTNNYLYGCLNGVWWSTQTYFNRLSKNTYDRCNYVMDLLSTSGIIITGCTENYPTITGGTPTTATGLSIDTYFDYTAFNVQGSMTNIDYTNQASMAPGSEFKIIRNNDTDGSILVVTPTTTASTYTTAIPIPLATLDTPGTVTTAFNGSTIEFATAGTYDLTAGAHVGTLTFTNTSGGAVTVNVNPLLSYVNSGPSLTVARLATVSLTGIVSGSRIRVNNDTDNIELYNDVVTGTTLSFTVAYTADKSISTRAALTGYVPLSVPGLLTTSGASIILEQQVDLVYVANAIDGSTVTEFSPDYPDVYVDINDPDGIGYIKRLYAWYRYLETDPVGIITFFGGITAQDAANYVINSYVVNLKFKNTGIAVTFADAYIKRDDGASLIAPASNSLYFEPGRAYLASGSGGSGMTVGEFLALK